jgi:hypothetical protein
MRFLVLGATGGIGRLVLEQALARGHSVTAFVPSPQKIQLQNERLLLQKGDPFNTEQLAGSIPGMTRSSLPSALHKTQRFFRIPRTRSLRHEAHQRPSHPRRLRGFPFSGDGFAGRPPSESVLAECRKRCGRHGIDPYARTSGLDHRPLSVTIP